MDRRPVIVGMTVACLAAGAIVCLWVSTKDGAGVPPAVLDEEFEPAIGPAPKDRDEVAQAPIASSRFSDEEIETLSDQTGGPKTESQPWKPSQLDRSNALYLSRMLDSDFTDVLSLITTAEKADALARGVMAMKALHNPSDLPLMSELAKGRLAAGQFETLTERQYSKRFSGRARRTSDDHMTLCMSGMDPETKDPRFRILMFRRGDDPRIDAALDDRAVTSQKRTAMADDLMAQLRR